MNMTPAENLLWQRLQAYAIDDPGLTFSFTDRLARENGWTKQYTGRVIDEYKKFLFLCCIAETGVTPSDAVDQAWHLHLTYTKSYWVDLCRNTLQQEIHHNPTKGGEDEAKKFDRFYTALDNLYKEKFEQEPPRDVWPDNETRFSDIRFQRVNLRKYWLIKKPALTKNALLLMALILFAVLSVQAMFDVSSYLFMGFLVVVVIVVIRNRKKGGDGLSGCTTASGCSTNHHGDSGCSNDSGCSGCGGCSGD